MFQAPTLNLLLILPWLIIVGTAVVVMLLDLVVRAKNKTWMAWTSLIGITLAFTATIGLWVVDSSRLIQDWLAAVDLNQIARLFGEDVGTFIPKGGTPMVMVDNYSLFINAIILVTAFMTVLISLDYLRKVDLERGEYYYLMLFSVSGMMLMAMANDLILIFLALELLSIPLYVLAGFAQPRVDSEESAMKYFLLGAFASGFLVFGIAMVYGATGATALPEVLSSAAAGTELLFAGAVLILVGLAFKVAAVPFHMWTPDVYEGAPTSVTAFMSVGAKVAGFAALIRIFIYALPDISDAWVPALAVIAALTMITGNVIALVQTNVKRMLAYSSIAHAGFIMMGVAASSDQGMSAALFYLLAYLFTTLGAFAVVIAVERKDNQGVMLDDYKGLYKRSPLMALALAYFMLSLTGIPPTGGFTAKFGVFGAVINADMTWLAVIAVITSIISAYYYLRPVFYSFMFDGEGEVVVKPAITVAVAVAVVLTFVLGVYPGPFMDAAREAVFSGVQVLAGG